MIWLHWTWEAWVPVARTFDNEITCASGWEAEAKQIQDLYLDGKKELAAAAVPADLLAPSSLEVLLN